MPKRRCLFTIAFTLFVTMGLVGCNGEEKGKTAQNSAKQIEINKSNGYITAANVSSAAFGRALSDHLQTTSPKLASGRKLDNYVVVPIRRVTEIRRRLEDAIAREGSIPKLDQAARDYAAAIVAFEPINNGLANYAESKGFLTDGGAKARAEDAAFVEALTNVVSAEEVFFTRIGERDERLTREAFDTAPEGSVERYRAGVILHAKAAMKIVTPIFTDPGDIATRQQFAASLNEMSAMVERWDQAVRAEKPDGCTMLQGSFNRVIAQGRGAVQSAEQGRFNPGKTPSVVVQQEYNILQTAFASMISHLNNPRSC